MTEHHTAEDPTFGRDTRAAYTGLILGAMQLDFAWVYEFGEYFVASEATQQVPIRNALTTNRVYASIIYRFSGRWLP